MSSYNVGEVVQVADLTGYDFLIVGTRANNCVLCEKIVAKGQESEVFIIDVDTLDAYKSIIAAKEVEEWLK